MTMFLLTIAGALSILVMIRSVLTDNLSEGVLMGVFGFISFVLTAILTNAVSP